MNPSKSRGKFRQARGRARRSAWEKAAALLRGAAFEATDPDYPELESETFRAILRWMLVRAGGRLDSPPGGVRARGEK